MQHSDAEAQVLKQVLQPPRSADIAAHLLHLPRTAESKTGLSSRFLGTVALGDKVARMKVQMKAQLLFELLFILPSAKQAMQPIHPPPPSDILRIRPTASVSRSQPAASVSSCVRPFRVRR